MKDYEFMVVMTSKHVGQWTVELAKMESGVYEIIMTRDTDCLYDCVCFETEDTALKMYKGLKRVHQIMNYVKSGDLWLEGVRA